MPVLTWERQPEIEGRPSVWWAHAGPYSLGVIQLGPGEYADGDHAIHGPAVATLEQAEIAAEVRQAENLRSTAEGIERALVKLGVAIEIVEEPEVPDFRRDLEHEKVVIS